MNPQIDTNRQENAPPTRNTLRPKNKGVLCRGCVSLAIRVDLRVHFYTNRPRVPWRHSCRARGSEGVISCRNEGPILHKILCGACLQERLALYFCVDWPPSCMKEVFYTDLALNQRLLNGSWRRCFRVETRVRFYTKVGTAVVVNEFGAIFLCRSAPFPQEGPLLHKARW